MKFEGQSSPWEDKYFSRFKFEEIVDVPAGAKLGVQVFIAKSLSENSYVTTYSGSDGSGTDYKTLENEHMGLFEIESHSDSANGTSVSSGQIPELFYHLA